MSTPVLNKPDSAKPAAAAPHRIGAGVFRPASLVAALPNALKALDPRVMWHNPVMFVVEIGALLTTVTIFTDFNAFTVWIAVWLWLTVVFANLADSVAEGRGKAQAASLRAGRDTAVARKLGASGQESSVPAAELRTGDLVVCQAGDVIPGDGEIVEGVASVDEAAITGESAPVVRESGGDRSSVTGGTRVLSDRIVIRITAEPGQSFVDRMIALVEGSVRSKTPNEIALNILLASLTIVFLLVVMVLQPMSTFSGSVQSIAVLVSLLVCLIPTTIGALVSAIGVAGMDRLVQRNVLAMSGRAVEAAGDVSTLLLDKTGTITFGNRQASELIAAPGVDVDELAAAALTSSMADETPEGRSLVELCRTRYDIKPRKDAQAEFIEFSARTRMSGVDLATSWGIQRIRKGAASAVSAWVAEHGGKVSGEVNAAVGQISASGGTPLLVAEVVDPAPSAISTNGAASGRVLGVVHLKDVVKPDIADRFAELRKMGIRTVMITGDSQLTAKSIAAEAGVDDFLAEATPEDKLAYIRKEQTGGRIVAMTGDGTNDAPALAQADVGVAMNSGTTAAKEAGNMVDLDSSPTKLIDIVEIGKQLLITRGALTTFSLANDIAKYFAILPAMFVGVFPGLQALNIMKLATPQSAVLSAVIFNALIIIALIPLALRGVRYTPSSAAKLLTRNLWIYGLGGLILPFVGIKLIDLFVHLIPGIG